MWLLETKESGASMSPGTVLVKEEPVEEEAGSRGAREAGARAGLCADRAVKDELGLGPEAPQPRDVTFTANDPVSSSSWLHVMTKEEILKEETDCKEEESEWDSAGSSGVSAEAARAGLYSGHAVEGELVLGPEGPQPRDAAFALRSSEQALAVSVCEPEPAPERGRGGEQPAPRDCSVRLERCAGLEALLGRARGPAGRAARPATSVVTESKTEKGTKHTKVSPEKETYICDICSRRFAPKSRFLEHVMAAHIHAEPAGSASEVAGSGSRAARAPARGQQPGPPSVAGHGAAARPAPPSPAPRVPSECPTCHKQFSRSSSLKIHIRTHTGEKPFTCGICKRLFRQSSTLKTHEQIHTGEKRYSCSICKMQIRNLGNLRDHERLHTGDKPYSCEICKKRFTQSSTLKAHERIHTGDKRYSCDTCVKQFTYLSNLKEHERIHTGQKFYSCELCKKQFAFLSNLKVHKRAHTGEKSYSCEICKKQFAQWVGLKVHERIHTGDKPYSCGICKKQFRQSSYLKGHERIHTGEKPYSCGICKKQFRQSSTLKTHERIHTGDKRYSCGTCKKKYTQLGNLKTHERIHTGEKPPEKYVKKQLTDSRSMTKHRRTRTGDKAYTCELCKKGFTAKKYLVAHILTHMRGKRS